MKLENYLYYFPDNKGIKEENITKDLIVTIGTKYIYTEHSKVYIETLKECSNYTPIQYYSSMEKIKSYIKRKTQISYISNLLCNYTPFQYIDDFNVEKLYNVCKEIFGNKE